MEISHSLREQTLQRRMEDNGRKIAELELLLEMEHKRHEVELTPVKYYEPCCYFCRRRGHLKRWCNKYIKWKNKQMLKQIVDVKNPPPCTTKVELKLEDKCDDDNCSKLEENHVIDIFSSNIDNDNVRIRVIVELPKGQSKRYWYLINRRKVHTTEELIEDIRTKFDVSDSLQFCIYMEDFEIFKGEDISVFRDGEVVKIKFAKPGKIREDSVSHGRKSIAMYRDSFSQCNLLGTDCDNMLKNSGSALPSTFYCSTELSSRSELDKRRLKPSSGARTSHSHGHTRTKKSASDSNKRNVKLRKTDQFNHHRDSPSSDSEVERKMRRLQNISLDNTNSDNDPNKWPSLP